MRRITHMIMACWLVGGLCACEEDNPDRCSADSQCAARDPRAPVCHPTKFFCYTGCTADADCRDTSSRAFEPDKPICDRSSGHCIGDGSGDGGTDGGAGDGGSSLPLGSGCGGADQCLSGFCVDGVCCENACQGTCVNCALTATRGRCVNAPDGDDPRLDCTGSAADCAGSCDGQGACRFPDDDTNCGGPRCSDGVQTNRVCDGAGACIDDAVSCGGYRCATNRCRDGCEPGQDDCLAGFICSDSGVCENDLPPGAVCGENDAACASKKCVDGVCCQSDCDGPCERCDLEAQEGSCQPVPDGEDPDEECDQGNALCAGRCNGDRACAYPGSERVCNGRCTGSPELHVLEQQQCDGAGQCDASWQQQHCDFALCIDAGLDARCLEGCLDHDECLEQSVCDRTAAHLTGRGRCIDPDAIVPLTQADTNALKEALAVVVSSEALTHIKVSGGPYNEKLSIGTGSVSIVGIGDVSLEVGSGNQPGVLVSGTASASLQGLTITLGGTNVDADGVRCQGTSSGNPATLVVVESAIRNNTGQGIDANNCTVTLRRNAIQSNAGGGAALANGTFTLVNNLIASNGTGTSLMGGIQLVSGAAESIVYNNTISRNAAGTGAVSGATCTGFAPTLTNNIVWGNIGGTGEVLGCTFTSSDIPGGTGTNIDEDPKFDDPNNGVFTPSTGPPLSPCIDAGAAVPASVTVIDIEGTARQEGGTVDIGAYEVQ